MKGDARGGIKAVNTKQHLQLSQDSTAPSSTVSTLESDLNSRITEANLRRKEDAEVTKRELARIEEQMSSKLTDVAKQLKNHDTGLVLLHEGQMHLEMNLKMLMTKMGVTLSNSHPLDAPVQSTTTEVAGVIVEQQANSELTSQGEKTSSMEKDTSVERDLDGDFRMTEETFNQVLEDCSRRRGDQPPSKYQKVSSPIDLEGGDDTL